MNDDKGYPYATPDWKIKWYCEMTETKKKT